MNKNTICVFGVVSDCAKGLKASKVDGKWHTAKMCYFTITDNKGDKYDTCALDEDCYCDVEDGEHIYAKGWIGEQGELVAGYVDRWGRHCDHCGKHHTEGYYINDYYYACSDECAYALMGGKEAFEATFEYDEDGELADDSPTYWTTWE